MALDLGGTNFRVILLELDEGKVKNEVVKMYHIGSDIRVGDENVAVKLFDYIGQCLCDFVEENDLVSVPLPLGKPKENLSILIRLIHSLVRVFYSSTRVHIFISNEAAQLAFGDTGFMGKIVQFAISSWHRCCRTVTRFIA